MRDAYLVPRNFARFSFAALASKLVEYGFELIVLGFCGSTGVTNDRD
jgi:hypothetical protein